MPKAIGIGVEAPVGERQAFGIAAHEAEPPRLALAPSPGPASIISALMSQITAAAPGPEASSTRKAMSPVPPATSSRA